MNRMSRKRDLFPRLFLVAAAVLFFVGAAFGADILVSRPLAEELDLSEGDTLNLYATQEEETPTSYRVVGVYEPTPDPIRITQKRYEVRLHLPDLLEPYHGEAYRGSVRTIHVRVADGESVEEVAGRISRNPWLTTMPTLGGTGSAGVFVALERFHFAIAAITMLGSSAFLLALMVMRAEERKEMAGVLRILGVRRRRILGEVLAEGVLIAVPGALFGLGLSVLFQGAVNRFFQWKYDTALVFVRITLDLALRCLALSVPLGILAGLVASWAILRQDPLHLVKR